MGEGKEPGRTAVWLRVEGILYWKQQTPLQSSKWNLEKHCYKPAVWHSTGTFHFWTEAMKPWGKTVSANYKNQKTFYNYTNTRFIDRTKSVINNSTKTIGLTIWCATHKPLTTQRLLMTNDIKLFQLHTHTHTSGNMDWSHTDHSYFQPQCGMKTSWTEEKEQARIWAIVNKQCRHESRQTAVSVGKF